MAAPSAITTNRTNFVTAKSCVQTRNKLRMNLEIAATARRLFPLKTAMQLVEITGYPQRTVEYWLTGNAKIPSDAIAMLLQSEWGVDFLGALIGSAKPSWWRKTLSYFAAVDAMSLQRRARRKLQEAIDADAELRATISRAEALAIHDEEHARPYLDALRAQARPVNRAMAPPRKR
jgi:hypothetical protein